MAVIVCALQLASPSSGQSLDDRLDEEAFLRGVIELRLPDVLKAYVAAHPTDDPFQLARFAIAAQQIALADPTLPPAERFKIIERIREIRAKLLTASPPDDPRAVIVMADQGSDVLFELLPTDATGLTALLGVPTPEQRQIAKRAANDLYTLARQVQQRAEQAIRSLESRPGFATDFALQDQRRRLAEEQRDQRIPFLLGVGAVLLAELNTTDAAQQKALSDQAVQLLAPLIDRLPPAVKPTAQLYLALAQWRRGDFDAALKLTEQVQSDPHAAPLDSLAAQLASVRITAAKSGPAAGLATLDNVEKAYLDAAPGAAFRRLLIADQRFTLRKALADAAPPEQRPPLLATAIAAYTDLLNVDLGVPRDTVVAAVFDRLTVVSSAATPDAPWPAIVAIAQADRLSAQGKPEAMTMLVEVIDRGNLADFEHALALFVLGKALYAAGRNLDAADRFIDLADRFSADPQAGRAIDLGVAIATEARRTSPRDDRANATLARGLNIALANFTNQPTIDQWRLIAAQLALDQHRFDDADRILEQIPSSSNRRLDALYLLAVTAYQRAAAEPDEPGGRLQPLNEAALPIIELATAALSEATANEKDPAAAVRFASNALMLHVLRAQTLLALNRPQDALDALTHVQGASNSDPLVVAEALRVRIESHQALNQPQEAVDEIKSFLETAPVRAAATILPMLQAIEAQVAALRIDMRDSEAQALADGTLLPIAKLLESSMASGALGEELQDAAGRRIAEAYRLNGQSPEALTWYERLLAAQPTSQPLLLGRAECLYALGGEARLAQAMIIFKGIAANAAPQDADYWLAQLRMLQILDATGRNTQQIVPRIDRLRQSDANLGGERFRREFDALRGKYAK